MIWVGAWVGHWLYNNYLNNLEHAIEQEVDKEVDKVVKRKREYAEIAEMYEQFENGDFHDEVEVESRPAWLGDDGELVDVLRAGNEPGYDVVVPIDSTMYLLLAENLPSSRNSLLRVLPVRG